MLGLIIQTRVGLAKDRLVMRFTRLTNKSIGIISICHPHEQWKLENPFFCMLKILGTEKLHQVKNVSKRFLL